MAGGQFSTAKLYGMTIRESATDGSDFSNPDADYRRLFLGEDGLLHLRDSAGAISSPAGMILLFDTTLSGTATSIDTSTVLGGYKHLRGYLSGRSDRAGQVFEGVDIQLNGDTGSNYDSINNDFNGSTTVGNNDSIGAAQGQLGAITGATGVANTPGALTFDVPDYGSTVFHKTYHSQGGVVYANSATNAHNAFNSGKWRSTAAITRIVVKTRNASNFIVGTRLTIYGLG